MEEKTRETNRLNLSLTQAADVLWHGRRLIALCMFVSGMIGFIYGMSKQSIYEAQALLQVEPRNGALNLPGGLAGLLGDATQSSVYRTPAEMQILKSRSIMRIAAEKINYDLVVAPRQLPVMRELPLRLGLPYPNFSFLEPFQWGNEALILSHFLVPDSMRGRKFLLTTTADGYVLRAPDGTEYFGSVGEKLEIGTLGVSVLVSAIRGPVGREYWVFRSNYDDVVAKMQRNFFAVEAPINSSILRVTYQDTDPRQAERVLDAILAAYTAEDTARSAQEASSSIKFIEEQLPLARQSVEDAQATLNAYRSAANSVDVDYETRSLLVKETRLEDLLGELELRERVYKDRYTAAHPLYESLLKEREELQAQLRGVRELTEALPDTQKKIYNITRDLQVAQNVYVQLLSSQQELQVARAAAVGSVKIIDAALAADIRVRPITSVIVVALTIVGALFGSFCVFFQALTRREIIDTDELQQFGLEVYGVIPIVKGKKSSEVTNSGLLLDTKEIAEAMQSLRTSLYFGFQDVRPKVLSITSAHPGAGKSFCARNLAASYAAAGIRVCLIDADMRLGRQAEELGLSARVGLSNVLSGSLPLEQAIQLGPVDGLSVLPSGPVPKNPSGLLMSTRFSDTVNVLAEDFDIVLLDCPPVLAVTDPLIVSRIADCTLIIARQLVTTVSELKETMRVIDLNKLTVVGAVLNGVDSVESARYGYGAANNVYQYYDYG